MIATISPVHKLLSEDQKQIQVVVSVGCDILKENSENENNFFFQKNDSIPKQILMSQLSIKNVNKRFFRQIIELLITYYSDYQISIKQQKSKQIQQQTGIPLIDILLELKKIERSSAFSLKYYRVIAFKLNEFSVSQMKEEDLAIHKYIFKSLFKQKQYNKINLIKDQIMTLVYNIIDFQKRKLNQSSRDNIFLDSNNMNLQENCVFSDLNLEYSQNQIERIESGLIKLQKSIYVTRI